MNYSHGASHLTIAYRPDYRVSGKLVNMIQPPAKGFDTAIVVILDIITSQGIEISVNTFWS